MSEAQVAQAHRRFVNELIDAAAEDNVVTDEEYETLVRVAAALVVDQATVEHRIASFRTRVTETTMTTGMQVVFTGDHPTYERDWLESAARTKGLEPRSGVSKATNLVFAADPLSRSGKAAKARKYGIPVMSIDAFLDAEIGDALEVSGSVESLKVVTCPECHVTWTVPATSSAQTRRRCNDCAPLPNAPVVKSRTPNDAGATSVWSAPAIEWLNCRSCTSVWSRQISKGRKPHFCPTCAGVSPLPPPPGLTVPG
jgi:hypothetical protein